MKRVICHWSEGNYKANSTDIEHYHILIEGDGSVRGGDHTILDNVSTSDGNYAAHTLGTNTGSIGLACCCMAGCQESPFKPGSQPMKKSQWNVMVKVVAELCQFYGIPVTPTTVLGHGEVQANLGIKQKGKWDPMVWPWDTSKTRKQVGAALRQQVSAALAQLGGGARRAATPTRALAAVDGESYTLRSALLANNSTLRRIVETSLVLVPPQHPEPVSGIEVIQEAINRLATAGVTLPRIRFGAGGKFRGWFGPQTVNALRAFQRLAKIDVDAKIGDDTLRALDNALVAAGIGGSYADRVGEASSSGKQAGCPRTDAGRKVRQDSGESIQQRYSARGIPSRTCRLGKNGFGPNLRRSTKQQERCVRECHRGTRPLQRHHPPEGLYA